MATRNSRVDVLMMPCEPWQPPHVGALVAPSFMTRLPWKEPSYIADWPEWQLAQDSSVALRHQSAVCAAECSPAVKLGWQLVQSRRECTEEPYMSGDTARLACVPLAETVPDMSA